MKKTAKTMLLLGISALTIAVILLLAPHEALARAGGGGGRGGGLLALILWPVLAVYSAVVTHFVIKKHRESRRLLDKLRVQDKLWDPDRIKARVEQAYFQVQRAWMERNQDIAREFMSDRLYAKHKLQTDSMIREGRKNILEQINLVQARVIQVADYTDDARDSIWVYIRGSMIDYIINDRTKIVISGNKKKPEEFAELWKFIRGSNGWLLDEIDQKVHITDVAHLHSFSEESPLPAS